MRIESALKLVRKDDSGVPWKALGLSFSMTMSCGAGAISGLIWLPSRLARGSSAARHSPVRLFFHAQEPRSQPSLRIDAVV